MRIGSLCIGVVDYEHAAYGSSSRRLRFATSDATAFSEYLRSASGNVGDNQAHRLLLDHEATLPNALRHLSELTATGEFDLFVIYLAGHGERGDSAGGWFCLADAVPSVRSLDAIELEKILNALQAHSVLVVADCCHAEALLGGMRYFSTLNQEKARLFVASARRDQLAWEDADLQRSILSDVFLRACSTASPIQSTFGTVQIESRLFPYLREQVPLLAAAQKQGTVQEPVTGGTARSEVALPVVDSKSFGRSLTIAQTVQGRVRQILLKGSVAFVVVILGVQSLVYHLTADSAGQILVRPGLPFTNALFPVALSGEVDTGIRVTQLDRSQGDPTAIAESRLWGFSSHLDVSGIRNWFPQVASLLKTQDRIRMETLVGLFEPSLLPTDSSPPIDQVLFLSQLRGEPPIASAASLYEPRKTEVIGCNHAAAQTLDYTLLSVPTEPYARDIWWQSLLARSDSKKTDEAIRSQVLNTAYRARQPRNIDEATTDLMSLALSMASVRDTQSNSSSLPNELTSLLETSCRLHAALALHLLDLSPNNRHLEEILVKEMLSADRDKQGDMANASQTMAAQALMLAAASTPLHLATTQAIASALIEADPQLDRPTLPLSILTELAQKQTLPKPLVDHLLLRLDAPERPHDFGQLTALDLLSRNMVHLPAETVKRVASWTVANAQRYSTMSDVHSAVGFLLAHDNEPHSQLVQLLADQLSPDTYFAAPTYGYRGELSIYATGDAAAIALGRALQSRPLPNELVERLTRFAIGRPEVMDRQVVVDGLASHWYGSIPTAEDIYARILETRRNSRKRELEAEVACSRMLLETTSVREGVRDGLLKLWRIETEPEVRIALATVVARSAWPRHGDLTMCKPRPT